MVAMREKDQAFASALIAEDLVTVPLMLERARMLPDGERIRRRRVVAWIEAAAKRRGQT